MHFTKSSKKNKKKKKKKKIEKKYIKPLLTVGRWFGCSYVAKNDRMVCCIIITKWFTKYLKVEKDYETNADVLNNHWHTILWLMCVCKGDEVYDIF
jgi:hypothetical protein